ncbi:TrbI/VirB10 family protein [Ralstonia solanacearum]|uniref:TrbI/VirB10 family protein n=1 Tax=Ralstonia solanacearum TaxID=305 RepID=UPI0005C4C6FF|nr:TrbI/VirB10 family protein [Ralstonia solanacearum]MBB6592741.1 TrbI/VirB10 family protein [Ralstonia solanacearum]MBB6596963.1 TrbI/VirB10 family protein [Ralstonia solanacearum]MDB0541207.1 TrbI/VirB10 family protein [Ralstonia solanacearum]MDB0551419.1 TrbI/VirB10 family protein [Ralstonia solanacearum]MDB0556156.1 TrbI/VirB10 family protein [Ralstonia solanacearum]
MRKQVEDVTDARERVSKGKVPKGIIYVAAGIAAVLIGTLAFYYQSKSDAEVKEASEERRAEKMKSRATAGEASQNLGQQIRAQQQAAKDEASRQEASAVKADTNQRTPVMSAKDFTTGRQGTEVMAQKNDEDNVFTAPIYKAGMNKVRDNARSRVDLRGTPDPSAMRAMQQAAAAAANATGAQPPGEAAPVNSDQQFLKQTAATKYERTGIAGRLPGCTVSQGFVIPATFVGGNNSDKPGEFRAMVSQNVWDTVDGTCLAIPAGSMLVGTYSSDISIGQERLLVAFTRLQLPNKKWVPLGSMQGADTNGYSGVSGDVNNHFFKIFYGAVVIAVLEQRFNNQQTATTVNPSGLTTYGNAAGQVATQTAQTILNRNQNIRPTITTDPAQKLLVQVKQDIVLEPYHE